MIIFRKRRPQTVDDITVAILHTIGRLDDHAQLAADAEGMHRQAAATHLEEADHHRQQIEQATRVREQLHAIVSKPAPLHPYGWANVLIRPSGLRPLMPARKSGDRFYDPNGLQIATPTAWRAADPVEIAKAMEGAIQLSGFNGADRR